MTIHNTTPFSLRTGIPVRCKSLNAYVCHDVGNLQLTGQTWHFPQCHIAVNTTLAHKVVLCFQPAHQKHHAW